MISTLGVSVKNRNEFSDYDYIAKLPDKELDWLKRFHKEYLQANIHHVGAKIIKGKRNHLALYDMNNARNRDLYSYKLVRRLLDFDTEVRDYRFYTRDDLYEDYLIHSIDNSNDLL